MDEYTYDVTDYDESDFREFEESEIPISLSYSRLSDFDRNGPKVLIERSIETSYAMQLGRVVDELLLPTGEYEFKDKFVISDLSKPTATSGRLVDIIMDNYTELPDIEEIIEICKRNKFWSSYKEETLIETLEENQIIEYLMEQFEASEKEIIPSKMYMDSRNLVDLIKIHRHSEHIFNNVHENINQHLIRFKYKGVIFRGVIDRICINHEDKTIQLIDLKTGKGDYESFLNSFRQYRYYLQAILYEIGINQLKEEMGLKDYEVLPFQFLYIGRGQRIPMIFTMTEKWRHAALSGFLWGNYIYRGLIELIDEVKWHFNNNQFELTREAYENKGKIDLPDNLIEI